MALDLEAEAENWYNTASTIRNLAERRLYYEGGLKKGLNYHMWAVAGFASLALIQRLHREDAEAALAKELQQNPLFWFGWSVLGNLRGDMLDYEGSITALQEAVRLNPNHTPS